MNLDGFAVAASSSTWTAADPIATHHQLHGLICAGDGDISRHATDAEDVGGISMRSGMSLGTSGCWGRAGGQRGLEEQEVASERWLWQQGGGDVKEGGGVQGPIFLGCGAIQQRYSGGCCGEQTSLRMGLGTAFPGSQPLEAALLQLLSFHSSG